MIDEEDLGAGWSLRTPLPEARRNANSVLTADGAIITIGGNGLNDYEDAAVHALRYDPAPTPGRSCAPGSRSAATTPPRCCCRTGASSRGRRRPHRGGGASDEIEVFSPPYLFKGPRPAIVSAPDAVVYGAGFSVTTSGEAWTTPC